MPDKYKALRVALEAGEFDFGQKCCERGEWSGNPSEPPECCGQPLTAADDIRVLLADCDALEEALVLALVYWKERQQRYKNRSPVWVQKARAALAQANGEPHD